MDHSALLIRLINGDIFLEEDETVCDNELVEFINIE